MAALLLGLLVIRFQSTAAAQSTQPAAATAPSATDQQITNWVAKLVADDPAQRESAAAALVAIGAAARPAVVKAAHGDDPALREQATQVLFNLPWYLPDDPEPVRKLLADYGTPDIDTRMGIARQLTDLERANVPVKIPISVYERLLLEDPNPEIRWIIVAQLHSSPLGPELRRFRDLKPSDDDAPLLALCGFANLGVNQAKTRDFLQRCADRQFSTPTQDSGQFAYVVKALAEFACIDHKYNVAADLRRKQLEHTPPQVRGDPSDPLVELFALQANYGPLDGLDNDIKLAGDAIDSLQIQYALSRLYALQGKKDQAEAARFAAWTASTTPHERAMAGDFLYEHGWDDLAIAEFNEMLKMQGDVGPDDVIDTHFKLAGIAIKHGDDFTAAQEKQLAISSMGDDNKGIVAMDGLGQVWPVMIEQLQAEIHWRYMRAALAKHDEAQVTEQLRQLINLKPEEADIAIEVVPLLQERHQKADAQAVFDSALSALKTKLQADPTNPELLNSLAWLCAKCDLDLNEALQWAQQASDAMPADSAIIDTLAEVNFHLGHPAEAARLEARALEITPGDDFMTKQLQRFKAAATSQSSMTPSSTTRPD